MAIGPQEAADHGVARSWMGVAELVVPKESW